MNAQDMEKGMETKIKVFRRPCFIIRPEQRPPNKAPNKDKLAIHDPCCSVILMLGKWGAKGGNLSSSGSSVCCNEAKAGEV